MVIGAAFYGREWKDIDWSRGNFPAHSPVGTFVGTTGYRDLKGRDLAAEGFRAGYDSSAGASYYASKTGFISLDDPRSICAKARWAMAHHLAGIFAWQESQDDGSLTDAMRDGVDGRCKERAPKPSQ
jgi:chitinase